MEGDWTLYRTHTLPYLIIIVSKICKWGFIHASNFVTLKKHTCNFVILLHISAMMESLATKSVDQPQVKIHLKNWMYMQDRFTISLRQYLVFYNISTTIWLLSFVAFSYLRKHKPIKLSQLLKPQKFIPLKHNISVQRQDTGACNSVFSKSNTIPFVSTTISNGIYIAKLSVFNTTLSTPF